MHENNFHLYMKFFKKTMQAILLLVWILTIKIQMPRNSTTIQSS